MGNGSLQTKDADNIPAASLSGSNPADSEHDFGKSIRLIQKAMPQCRAAYQLASVSAKGLVEDADKLDIVVKACQTEYIKLKLLNNNAKAYVNAKRLKWQTQADCFRYWAEFVHFETIGAIQREMEDLVNDQKSTMERIEAEKAALMAELQARFGHMSAEEIERKMRQFMKRWINRKVIGPFRTWKGLLEAKKQAA